MTPPKVPGTRERRLLDSRADRAKALLQALDVPPPAARRTRRQWAEEVLSRHEPVTEHNWWSEEYSAAARAAVYLMHVDGTDACI